MPIPTADETKAEFMEHCPGDVMDDGTTDDHVQAVAICESTWAEERTSPLGELRQKLDSFFNEFWATIKRAVSPQPDAKERALAMSRVYERARIAIDAASPMEWVFIHDIFQDGDAWFAIASSGGNLYQYPLTVTETDVVADERVQVIENFTPVQQTTVTRQEDGRYRWLSVSATAVVNKDGQIDSTALFDDFERQSLEDDFVWPYRCFYHLGEQFRTGQVDFIARWEYGLVTSGLYDDTELGRAEIQARLADPDGWRDSIHFQPSTAPDVIEVNEVKIPVHRAGGLIEVTTAPSDGVCSYGTTQTLMEVGRMKEGSRVHDAFLELFSGDEDAANQWLDANPGAATRAVAEGAVARADGDGDEGQQDDPPETQRVDVDDELVDVIAGRVLDRLGAGDGPLAQMAVTLEAMGRQMEDATQARTARAAQIDERLAALGRDDEQRTEEIRQDMPRRTSVSVGYRPREDNRGNGKGDQQETSADKARRVAEEKGHPTY